MTNKKAVLGILEVLFAIGVISVILYYGAEYSSKIKAKALNDIYDSIVIVFDKKFNIYAFELSTTTPKEFNTKTSSKLRSKLLSCILFEDLPLNVTGSINAISCFDSEIYEKDVLPEEILDPNCYKTHYNKKYFICYDKKYRYLLNYVIEELENEINQESTELSSSKKEKIIHNKARKVYVKMLNKSITKKLKNLFYNYFSSKTFSQDEIEKQDEFVDELYKILNNLKHEKIIILKVKEISLDKFDLKLLRTFNTKIQFMKKEVKENFISRIINDIQERSDCYNWIFDDFSFAVNSLYRELKKVNSTITIDDCFGEICKKKTREVNLIFNLMKEDLYYAFSKDIYEALIKIAKDNLKKQILSQTDNNKGILFKNKKNKDLTLVVILPDTVIELENRDLEKLILLLNLV